MIESECSLLTPEGLLQVSRVAHAKIGAPQQREAHDMQRMRATTGRAMLILALAITGIPCGSQPASGPPAEVIELPKPTLDGTVSLEAAIVGRRSADDFAATELTLAEIGQLAWAAQGITDSENGYRAAPSAGATYPLELYFVTPKGLMHYIPDGHRMERLAEGDVRPRLREAGLRQRQIAEAPLTIIMTAVYERTEARFGERARRYAHIEAGHVAQNVQLQAVALGLVSTPLGATDDGRARSALGLGDDEEIVYVICVGHAREE
jgi:SagB-type dehydrogenase family enzyme